MNPDDTDTVPPSMAPDTIPVLAEPEHEPFCIVRPVTFFPEPVAYTQTDFDLAAEELDEE